MPIRESSICGVVQSFPILLILAQKYEKCLKTPLIYEPPKATPSPEYYEALDALFQNLFGHGYYPGHEHGHSGCAYDHGTYGYGKKLNQNYAVASPCYTYSASPHSYNTHTHPIHSGYPGYGLKKTSVYDVSGTNGYKGTYAPTQVYNQNHKYKIVVKKNKKRTRPHKLQNERIHSRPKSAVENAPITAPITPTTPPVNKRLNTMQRCQVAGRSGECVVIETCDPFVRLIKHQRANPGPGLTRFFKEAHCGFDGTVPKVCCPILDQLPVEGFEETKSSSLQYGQKVPILDENDFVTHLPEPPVCGTSNASYFRDIGSTEAKLGEFPWMALLGYKTGEVTSWNCGGSLITSKHVLTAARCIHDQEESLYVVRLGEMDLIREDDGATPIDILIRKMVQHPQYDSVTVTNDIGFLVLQQEVEFTDFIHPICLPLNIELRTNTFERYNPMVAGWNMEYKGPAASWLQATQLPVISITACANAYKNHTTQLIDARVMCADGHADDSNGNCVGNSGDPLMLPIWYPQVRKAYFYQLGVVFFGKMCEQPGYPAVYTRVTAFVPWLEEMLLGKTPLDY